MYKNLKIEDEEKIRTIFISTDSPYNPLTLGVLKEIEEAIRSSTNRVIVITGSGKAFSAGANIKDFLNMSAQIAYEFSREGHSVMNYIANYPRPVIAAIHGFALGGGFELALACDIRIAHPDTKMGLPEITLGILPGFGGTQRLRKFVGVTRAFDLMATGKRISADEALDLGVVNEISEEYLARAKEYARQMSEMPPLSLELIKHLIITDSVNGFEEEMEAFGRVFESMDSIEGVKAFLEKRKPIFTGRKR